MTIPDRVNCEVLPVDVIKEPIKLRIRQYNGFEIYDASTLKPIPASEPLSVGREIVFDDRGGRASVVQDDGSGPFVEAGYNRYVLEKCNDDRERWVCGGVMNMRAFMPRTKETLFK